MNLEDFTQKKKTSERKPDGIEWDAVVECQACGEDVEIQTLYPAECLLVWTCSNNHRSYIENYQGF